MAEINAIPDTYRRVTPCLVVDGAAEALEFYAEVFGAVERTRMPGPGGGIAHAEIEIGDAVLIVEDPMPGTAPPPAGGLVGSPVFHFVYVADVDATVARAAELGATVEREPTDQFYGDRDACVVDPFGHTWTVASHTEDVAPDELARRLAAMSEQA